MLRPAFAFACILAGLTASILSAPAQDDPIAARKTVMRSFGAASRDPGLMLRGEAPFDLSKVEASLKIFADGAEKLPALFPENSKSGDTKAAPAIWTEKAKFDAIANKLASDATAAAGSIKDEASFKATMPGVLGACAACHRDYRPR